MSLLNLYQVDSFSSSVFGGNPAGVVPLDDWIEDEILQNIATENNLSETAFTVRRGDCYEIRWYSPLKEVDLCGHATLAAAFVICNFIDKSIERVDFQSPLSGSLSVNKIESNKFQLVFPVWERRRMDSKGVSELFEISPVEVFDANDLFIVLSSEDEVRNFKPDLAKLLRLPNRGIVITSPGTTSDFVSRAFFPRLGIDEDPVTGSTHCALTPYWSEKLGKDTLHAKQLSKRGGEIECTVKDDKVYLSGYCALYSKGNLYL